MGCLKCKYNISKECRGDSAINCRKAYEESHLKKKNK